MARLQYGCGLRISELCSLRVKDVDLDRGKLVVRAGKGDKDRCIPLPRSMLEDLRAHLADVRAVHEKDRAEQRPGVYLPEALERKMPKDGVNIRTVQAFLGHAQVETTMIYLHVMEDQRERVGSPLDRVAG